MLEDKILISTKELQHYLGDCERRRAISIGEKANAKVRFGRVFKWNKKKIEAYINDLQE